VGFAVEMHGDRHTDYGSTLVTYQRSSSFSIPVLSATS
jgi:hypothetical protein